MTETTQRVLVAAVGIPLAVGVAFPALDVLLQLTHDQVRAILGVRFGASRIAVDLATVTRVPDQQLAERHAIARGLARRVLLGHRLAQAVGEPEALLRDALAAGCAVRVARGAPGQGTMLPAIPLEQRARYGHADFCLEGGRVVFLVRRGVRRGVEHGRHDFDDVTLISTGPLP